MGYDSFGLPAEQYAIQTGQHPAITTKVNIEGGKDKNGNWPIDPVCPLISNLYGHPLAGLLWDKFSQEKKMLVVSRKSKDGNLFTFTQLDKSF